MVWPTVISGQLFICFATGVPSLIKSQKVKYNFILTPTLKVPFVFKHQASLLLSGQSMLRPSSGQGRTQALHLPFNLVIGWSEYIFILNLLLDSVWHQRKVWPMVKEEQCYSSAFMVKCVSELQTKGSRSIAGHNAEVTITWTILDMQQWSVAGQLRTNLPPAVVQSSFRFTGVNTWCISIDLTIVRCAVTATGAVISLSWATDHFTVTF